HYIGTATDNPASADAIRSAESRLVKRAERKQRIFGGGWEQVMRLVRRIQTGEWDPRLRQLETVWRDASTPTIAQKADAAIKLYTAPPGQRPIVPLRQTREDLGYSAAQIARMEAEDAREAEQDPLAALARAQAGGSPPGGSGRPGPRRRLVGGAGAGAAGAAGGCAAGRGRPGRRVRCGGACRAGSVTGGGRAGQRGCPSGHRL